MECCLTLCYRSQILHFLIPSKYLLSFIVLWQKENSFRIVNSHLLLWDNEKIEMVDHHSLKIRTHTKSFLKRKWDEKFEIKGTIKCVRFDLLWGLYTRSEYI